MATVTEKPARRSNPKAGKEFDCESIRRGGRRLIELNMSHYQKLIHTNLIRHLRSDFEKWLGEAQKTINEELKRIPEAARPRWLEERFAVDRRNPDNQAIRFLADFLFFFIQSTLIRLKELKDANKEFRKTVAKVRNDLERQQIILHYAEELGANKRQLEGDRKSFSRWFDEEAVTDRFLKHVGEAELQITFAFDRLSHIVGRIIRLSIEGHAHENNGQENAKPEELAARLTRLWKRLNFENRIQDSFVYDGDVRVHIAAVKSLRMVLEILPGGMTAELLRHSTMMFLNRTARECNSDVLIQCEALSILYLLSAESGMAILNYRLERDGHPDDIFVRRHALKLIEKGLARGEQVPMELSFAINDPSPFVRQKLASVAFLSDSILTHELWERLVFEDEVHQVRAAALLCGIENSLSEAKRLEFLNVLVRSLEREKHPFVLRTALLIAVRIYSEFRSWRQENSRENDLSDPTLELIYLRQILPAIERIETEHGETPLRRWAAQTREQLWAISEPKVNSLMEQLRPQLAKIPIGKSRRFSKKLFAGLSDEVLGRMFAALSIDDFGYDIKRGWFGVRIQRGPQFGFRLWRAFFELTHSATDKRQAHRHTTGRISNATIRSQSQILGELSQTKVPGEPFTIGDDGSWRPFLPLLDDFISVLNMSWIRRRTVKFYSSQGVTSVRGPRGLWRCIRTAYYLNTRFEKVAELRNWNESSFTPDEYIEKLRGLGFEVEFSNHPRFDRRGDSEVVKSDSTVTQFFGSSAVLGLPLASAGVPFASAIFETPLFKQLQQFSDYFSSAFENTLEQLVLFATVVLLLVLGRHFYLNFSFRRARNKIPLSIGGWGTRGKSGTERLKAALIGVLGHGLVSKTTGCEAMFIQSYAFGEPLEIPLFRPYDKATIWEHRSLIKMAAQLDPSVFLWECMALNPDYVDVLQRQWTCDDLATVTNTYPDHEDIQGPAGYNVATTISGFAPLFARLISTEEQMRPYLTDSCRKANSKFRGVGWLESGLITDDVLERFPYREHPDNIALVCAMGDELGLEYEFCLKAMADSLVPDLGVLKTHPKTRVQNCEIEFSNGMSANERFGCMGNWKRLGFDSMDPWEESSTWICGVVNNRADRVPRSKVFAKIIVEDMNADRFFLIGNNLKGLQGFIDEAWEDKEKTLSLRDRNAAWNVEFALKTMRKAAFNFRQPAEPAHVQGKLLAMLKGVANLVSRNAQFDPENASQSFQDAALVQEILETAKLPKPVAAQILSQLNLLNEALAEYQEMVGIIQKSSSGDAEKTEALFAATLKKWYFRKLVVVEDYDATGEDVISRVVEETPPGFLNRLMGLQNIKGTGLDFVYRFQAWDMCHEACQAMLDRRVAIAEQGLQAVVAMPEIGQLCVSHLKETIAKAKKNIALQRADLQAQLLQLENEVADLVDDKREGATSSDQPNRKKERGELNKWLMECAEQFLDVNDSVRRRNNADAIYSDLAAQRISRQRAIVELRKINKRQKGGWLTSPKAG